MEEVIGKVVHFFDKISVVTISLTAGLRLGEKLRFLNEKAGSDFTQSVDSLQMEHKNLSEAKAGQEVCLKVERPVKEGTLVYKVS